MAVFQVFFIKKTTKSCIFPNLVGILLAEHARVAQR
jgi:hypothetical protein